MVGAERWVARLADLRERLRVAEIPVLPLLQPEITPDYRLLIEGEIGPGVELRPCNTDPDSGSREAMIGRKTV